jgi:3-dehydrosphinganine reductase
MHEYFARKTVVVTGASSGIGRALACQLAESGANVLLLARSSGPLQDTVAELEQRRSIPGQWFRSYPVDVGDRLAVESVARAILTTCPVDMLINNAGIAYANYLDCTEASIIEDMVRTNYLGTVWLTRALVPHFKERRTGHIANVSSLLGVLGILGYAAYAPSKFAVVGFSDVLRNELRPFNIRVTVLLPPDTRTPQLEFENRTKPHETRAISGNVRALEAEDVARALLRGMAAGRYRVAPGVSSRLLCLAVGWFPGPIRWMLDRSVRLAQATRERVVCSAAEKS